MKIKKGFTLIRTVRKNLVSVKAFTLIELLVVISIIGILAALATVSFTSAQKQARDVARKGDLKMYQNALEIYANKYEGMYPSYSIGSPDFVNFCEWLGITGSCPNDPKYVPTDPDPLFPSYNYQTDGTSNVPNPPTATSYALWAKLENTTGYWVVCSSGSSFISTATPSIASCQ
jgi:prepilin-type N-terminal cleavage/methylation domain-containing protein